MSERPRFALRTIHKGAMRIRGLVFVPYQGHRPYDGRLDGLRMAFGLYYGPKGYDTYRASDGWQTKYVALWGTERAYRGGPDDWPGPECVDGCFPWEWWNAREDVP